MSVTHLASLGHWSMRAKTKILRAMLTELEDQKNPTLYQYKGILWRAASGGQVELTEEIFEKIHTKGMVVKGDSSPFDALLKAQTVSHNTDTARVVQVWRDMAAANIKPQKRSFDLFARAFHKAGKTNIARLIEQEARQQGISVEIDDTRKETATPQTACLHLLKISVKTKDIPTAEKAVFDLSRKHGVDPCSRVWNELLNVYATAERLSFPKPDIVAGYEHWDPDGLRDPNGFYGVWARMVTHGVSHNAWSYDNLLKAYGRVAHVEPVLDVALDAFRVAVASGLASEQHLWVRIMEVCAASCQTLPADDVAQDLLREMWSVGHAVKRDSRLMRAFTTATSKWASR
eukprot:TRINITY_DN38240_c0_g1_i1.p1 TRINITY_DN38240_c0_g1~~TRINITY_DN38240_c0_g1_i1.p1  ORF type:complete len:359 (+),score=58.03 TRINITY_DN38240_c0_g1_i1:41-1078(+)